MQRTEFAGLHLLLVDADEAVRLFSSGADAATLDGFDLVRVEPADPADWPRLRAHGFVPKPDRLTWLADTASDDDAFLAAMSARSRTTVRQARRWIANAAGTMTVSDLTEQSLAEFLTLYDDQLTRMPHGFPVAHAHRADLLARRASITTVQVRIGTTLVGSCIAEFSSDGGLARTRFSAVSADGRANGLATALYAQVAATTRQRGVQRMTLGNDPNLYGHLVQPGLFDFKRRLGFVPVPSRTVDASDGVEIADRVLSLRHLADPTLMVGLAADVPVQEGVLADLTLHSFGAAAEPTARTLPATVHWARSHRLIPQPLRGQYANGRGVGGDPEPH